MFSDRSAKDILTEHKTDIDKENEIHASVIAKTEFSTGIKLVKYDITGYKEYEVLCLYSLILWCIFLWYRLEFQLALQDTATKITYLKNKVENL